jgi:hypothetical protein
MLAWALITGNGTVCKIEGTAIMETNRAAAGCLKAMATMNPRRYLGMPKVRLVLETRLSQAILTDRPTGPRRHSGAGRQPVAAWPATADGIPQEGHKTMERPVKPSSTIGSSASDAVDLRPGTLDASSPTAARINRTALAFCWIGFMLFAVSLALPALRAQGKGEWIAGDLGCMCLLLSFSEFPVWVPHALLVAAPFVCAFAGPMVKKAAGLVLTMATVSILERCVPEVVGFGFEKGLLAGFWAWALALVVSTIGLLIGGFLLDHGTGLSQRALELPAEHARSRRGIGLCWAGLTLLLVLAILGQSFFFLGAGPRALGAGGFVTFMVYRFVVPLLLAMAPVACLYASQWTRRIMGVALLAFAWYQVHSYSAFLAGVPGTELSRAFISAFLTGGMSAIGVLISAGLPSRSWPVGAELADMHLIESKAGAIEAASSSNRSRLGAALCWVGLANALGLGSLPFALMWANETSSTLIASVLLNPYTSLSVIAMAPLVATYCGSAARRVVAALLALQVVGIIMLSVTTPIGLHGLPDAIAFGLSAAGLLSMETWPGTMASRFGKVDHSNVAVLDRSPE